MSRDGRASLKAIFTVARDPDLSAAEARLWMLIRSYEQPDGRGAYPGDEKLAAHMNCSERSVQRYRASLLEKGYLRREFRGSKPSYYWAELPQHSGASADGATESDAIADGASGDATPDATPAVSPEYGEYGNHNTCKGGDDEQRDLGLRSAVHVVWEHYVHRYAERYSESRADRLKLSAAGRDGHLRERLREGYSAEELCRAIDGCFGDSWHRDRDKHELEYIVRDQSKVEDFLNRAERNGGPPEARPDGREELAAMKEAAGE